MDGNEYVSPVVQPQVDVLTMSNGDTLTVKRKLNQGEKRRQYARMYTTMPDGNLGIVPGQIGLAMVVAYLVDWTIRGLDGKQIEILRKSPEEVESALDSLSPEMYDEIKASIEKHERAQLAKTKAEKNDQDGEKPSSAISPSAKNTAGDTTGSTS